jgi:muramoyltetrapeptide carboxypeptidase
MGSAGRGVGGKQGKTEFMGKKVKIGIVAPSSRLEPAMAERVTRLARERHPDAELRFHPQCYLSCGHFAGDDAARAAAFVEVANDASVDALWFGRGGYGSGRIAEAVLPRLGPEARRKLYLGYSDAGALLAGLYAAGFPNLAHGPMPADINRAGGEAAVARSLDWIVKRAPEALEPSLVSSGKAVAFNLMTFSQLIGTKLEPDLAGHVLMFEEVSEHMYRIDRSLFHVTSRPAIRAAAGIRLGRCSDIPPNDPDFVLNEVEVVQHWCKVSGIPYLGRADIGHDPDNKIVPFGSRGG